MLAALQPTTPIIVKVVGDTPKDIGVIDIIFGALGVTGIMLVGSAILGVLLGALIILVKKRLAVSENRPAPSSAYGFTPSSAPPEPESPRPSDRG